MSDQQNQHGVIHAASLDQASLNRDVFRIAVFGDFTGRAARGILETGAALAARRPIVLDVDTIEDVIARFATTLTLPIGKNGAGIEVKLRALDDLHPDALFEDTAIFAELLALRQRLSAGGTAENARASLKKWSQTYGKPIALPKPSASSAVPAHLKLTDFQTLIGDTAGATRPAASPMDDLIAQIVGPHIVKAPDADNESMIAAIDDALSSAMRLILHHPDFQSLEAQWRSLDFMARRIETDSTLEVLLFDVSAAELAVDVTARDELEESGFFQLLTGANCGFSTLVGLYTFEETPPHAAVLARIAKIAAHVEAPFFAAISPAFLETPLSNLHPLVTRSWDNLRALPEACYLGLAAPRFLLRQPYGPKSDPVSCFKFEEFTQRDGLSGMLWANPVVLVATLLGQLQADNGGILDLGTDTALDDLPFYYVADQYGDQVALPCTERNLTEQPMQTTLDRGFMPLVWIKGRNEVRLGSFQALNGDEIAGPWSGQSPRRPSPVSRAATLSLDFGVTNDAALDAFLADFQNYASRADGENETDEMDPKLAALLKGL